MNKLRIGEFSKLTRLSIKTLRLYDAEGLLVPASIDSESGYRYYTPDQVNLAETIRVLRSLDRRKRAGGGRAAERMVPQRPAIYAGVRTTNRY